MLDELFSAGKLDEKEYNSLLEPLIKKLDTAMLLLHDLMNPPSPFKKLLVNHKIFSKLTIISNII